MKRFSAKIAVLGAILAVLLSMGLFLQPRSNNVRTEVSSSLAPAKAGDEPAVSLAADAGKNEKETARLPRNALTDAQIEEDDLRYAVQLAESGDREMALMISRYRKALDDASFQREVAELARQQPSSNPEHSETVLRLHGKNAAGQVSEAALAIKQMVRHRRIHKVQPQL